ncbi:MAG: hypothetical protein WCA23_29200 [Stellaceae bacterium]
MFRHYPDALERATELDAQYGSNKDMRTMAGGDAAYDIDFPARDHILVEQLRRTRPPPCSSACVSPFGR